MKINITNLSHEEKYLRVSNGISLTRILAMFWIVMVNYFSTGLFRNYYKMEYQDAIATADKYLTVMQSNPWLTDKMTFILAFVGWSGVIAFMFLTGFSLWYSVINRGKFQFSDYVMRRFTGIYVSYFVAIVIAVAVGLFIKKVTPQGSELLILILGAAMFSHPAQAFNTPSWFVSCLMLFYLFFPIFPLIYSKFRSIGTFSFLILYIGIAWYLHLKVPILLRITGPMWLFGIIFCLGILFAHAIYKFAGLKIAKIDILKCLFIPVSIAGILWIYYFSYLIPAVEPSKPWNTWHPYLLGIGAGLAFFAAGYLVPIRFSNRLRWLSRGTFGVFLYHYFLYPFIIPHMKPDIFGGHLSLAMTTVYLLLLILCSLWQGLLDKTLIKWIKNMVHREFTLVV